MRAAKQKQKPPQPKTLQIARVPGEATRQSWQARHIRPAFGSQATEGGPGRAEPDDLKADPDADQSPHPALDFSRISIFPDSPAADSLRRPPLQTKLQVGEPGDAYEQEADRVSEQVMRSPQPKLQRACACGGGCTGCRTEEPGQERQRLRLKQAGSGEVGHAEAPPIVHEVLRSPGRPLDAATRRFMEPRFGHDFSRVRIHTDVEAARSAGQLRASAYTLGDHIAFAEGRFAPSTPEGGRLLAHELAHVVQGAGQSAILRRQPDPEGAQAAEARLRVSIVDALEATKRSAVDGLIRAIERGDRAYLQTLGLSPKQVNHLLNNTAQFKMMFGTAAELAVEQAVRADPFLNQYVRRGPVGWVPKGVGKPDWVIETPSSRIPVDLMTPQQVEEKLEMWRKQTQRGKPKWYVEKGLGITYERPPTLGTPTPTPGTPAPSSTQGAPAPTRTGPPPVTPPTATPGVSPSSTRSSGFRTAGRFLAREAPNVVLQAVLMAMFPPGVKINNDKSPELSRTKLAPAVEDALEKQEDVFAALQDADINRTIYANVTARFDYATSASGGGDLNLRLKDVALLRVRITHENIDLRNSKFNKTAPLTVSNESTYSFIIYEALHVKLDREWAEEQQRYQECLAEYGTGYIPVPAGVEAAEAAMPHPEAGPCIPPRMKPMEGP